MRVDLMISPITSSGWIVLFVMGWWSKVCLFLKLFEKRDLLGSGRSRFVACFLCVTSAPTELKLKVEQTQLPSVECGTR
jgi:hypothetical protein